MSLRRVAALSTLAGLLAASALLARPESEAILPPVAEWSGASRAHIVPATDPWITPAERSGLTETPRYEETVAWLRKLVAAAPELRLLSLGKSPEGRDLWLVIASREGANSAAELRANGRPTLFAQAGIHAGEIDGKDAGLMLLRDLTVRGTEKDLLERANFVFVPMLNVDGHERFSPFTRINQRGPVAAGWRTTAKNLNLNRDYAKLDAPETRMLVRALADFAPDLYFDLHVTDDTDHQYDITFGTNWPMATSVAIADWLERVFRPAVSADLRAMGHVPGPLIQLVDALDPAKGIYGSYGPPRFSTGYGDVRHLPTVLVENHSLKPYAQRVLGDYVLLKSALRLLGREGDALRRAVREDQHRRVDELVLNWQAPEKPTREIELLGIEWRVTPSPVSGGMRLQYTGRPETRRAAVYDATVAGAKARRPLAYWVPPTWPEVIERLRWHGIHLEPQEQARTVAVEMHRVRDLTVAERSFEGRVGASAQFDVVRRDELYAAGSVRVPTDQPLGDLAMALLEPAAPDSFFAWGFFHEVSQPTEYVEAYVMEPMAERMLVADAALRAAFEKKLAADPDFAKDPRARLQWFYERTPFVDERAGLLPIGREVVAAE
jgi:Zinc carboxypeptidase